MSGTAWGEFRWTDPEPVALSGIGAGVVDGKRIGLVVGKATIGCVCWYLDDGPYYPLTQLRQFGPMRDIEWAKLVVEEFAVFDAVTYPTMGKA